MKNPAKARRGTTGFFYRLLAHRDRVQAVFAAAWLAPLHWFSVCAPVFHCNACPLASFACPIGSIARAGALHVFPVAAVGTLLVVGLSLGTLTCGWACPFGWLQSLAAKVPIRRWPIPRAAGHFRYVVLAVAVLAVPIMFGGDHALFICRVCPAAGLEVSVPRLVRTALLPGPAIWPDAPKLVILMLFLGAIFVFERPWCRVLCPLGGLFGLFNKISFLRLGARKDRCSDCAQCRKACPAGLDPEKDANGPRCLRCLACLSCARQTMEIEPRFGP
ncbi:MAG: 4Fe-4S binding protein [Candidatus Aminicenantes bacterium]|nr:4Fe-4S binding protein [Candidatus Aminicenantes bacterium]NLH77811.1 4Fe-4S binding protein [Acidobacteriota bacterium]